MSSDLPHLLRPARCTCRRGGHKAGVFTRPYARFQRGCDCHTGPSLTAESPGLSPANRSPGFPGCRHRRKGAAPAGPGGAATASWLPPGGAFQRGLSQKAGTRPARRDIVRRQAGTLQPMPQDHPDGIRVQRPGQGAICLQDRAEQRAAVDAGRLDPADHRACRVRLQGQARRMRRAGCPGFPGSQPDHAPGGEVIGADVVALQSGQFAAPPPARGKAKHQECAVAPAAQTIVAAARQGFRHLARHGGPAFRAAGAGGGLAARYAGLLQQRRPEGGGKVSHAVKRPPRGNPPVQSGRGGTGQTAPQPHRDPRAGGLRRGPWCLCRIAAVIGHEALGDALLFRPEQGRSKGDGLPYCDTGQVAFPSAPRLGRRPPSVQRQQGGFIIRRQGPKAGRGRDGGIEILRPSAISGPHSGGRFKTQDKSAFFGRKKGMLRSMAETHRKSPSEPPEHADLIERDESVAPEDGEADQKTVRGSFSREASNASTATTMTNSNGIRPTSSVPATSGDD